MPSLREPRLLLPLPRAQIFSGVPFANISGRFIRDSIRIITTTSSGNQHSERVSALGDVIAFKKYPLLSLGSYIGGPEHSLPFLKMA
jgi:hypothetical protein